MSAVLAVTFAEGVEIAVAVGTGVLALATWRMADATKRMATAAATQVAESRRQSAAAEAAVDQGERTLAASTLPVLNVLRLEAEQAVVSADPDGDWSVMVENVGPVPATPRGGALLLPRQPVALEAVPGNAIEPGGQVLLRGTMPAPVLADILERSMEVPLRIVYRGPSGAERSTRVNLRPKGGGDRWLVTLPEQHKPA